MLPFLIYMFLAPLGHERCLLLVWPCILNRKVARAEFSRKETQARQVTLLTGKEGTFFYALFFVRSRLPHAQSINTISMFIAMFIAIICFPAAPWRHHSRRCISFPHHGSNTDALHFYQRLPCRAAQNQRMLCHEIWTDADGAGKSDKLKLQGQNFS